jgi:hypothetical protein
MTVSAASSSCSTQRRRAELRHTAIVTATTLYAVTAASSVAASSTATRTAADRRVQQRGGRPSCDVSDGFAAVAHCQLHRDRGTGCWYCLHSQRRRCGRAGSISLVLATVRIGEASIASGVNTNKRTGGLLTIASGASKSSGSGSVALWSADVQSTGSSGTVTLSSGASVLWLLSQLQLGLPGFCAHRHKSTHNTGGSTNTRTRSHERTVAL